MVDVRTPLASFNISVVQPHRGTDCTRGAGAGACADASSADGTLVRAHLSFGVHVETARSGEPLSGMLGGMIGAVAKIGIPNRPGELSEDNYFVWIDDAVDFRGAADTAFAVADMRAAGRGTDAAAAALDSAVGARCRGELRRGGCGGGGGGPGLAAAGGIVPGMAVFLQLSIEEGVSATGGRVKTMSGLVRVVK